MTSTGPERVLWPLGPVADLRRSAGGMIAFLGLCLGAAGFTLVDFPWVGLPLVAGGLALSVAGRLRPGVFRDGDVLVVRQWLRGTRIPRDRLVAVRLVRRRSVGTSVWQPVLVLAGGTIPVSCVAWRITMSSEFLPMPEVDAVPQLGTWSRRERAKLDALMADWNVPVEIVV